MPKVSGKRSKQKRGVSKTAQIKKPTLARLTEAEATKGARTLPRTQQVRIARRKAKRITGGKAPSRPLKFETRVTQVTSMRGRIHPMARQAEGQPETPQNVWVDSTVIAGIKYNEDKKVLEILFVSKHVYRYYNVPLDVVKGLLIAPSKGRYFVRMLRKNYDYRRIR